jgi:hypothetical protein
MAIMALTWAGLPSKTQTGAGTGTSDSFSPHIELNNAALFALNVSGAAAGAGDTLDVWLQHSWDEGVTFDDFIHFTQVLGNGGTLVHLCAWTLESSAPTPMHKAVTKTLAAASSPLLGPIGAIVRAQYTVANVTAAVFTFAIQVQQYDS